MTVTEITGIEDTVFEVHTLKFSFSRYQAKKESIRKSRIGDVRFEFLIRNGLSAAIHEHYFSRYKVGEHAAAEFSGYAYPYFFPCG